MIYIFGDSHGSFNFSNLDLPNRNLSIPSITIFRVGRDNEILNFEPSFNTEHSTFIFTYGEVDCRCHVKRQENLGREWKEVCKDLIEAYFNTIKNNVKIYSKIIICSITPTVIQSLYEQYNAPIGHEFPFVGTDQERLNYTLYMNNLIKTKCEENERFYYLDSYDYYSENGFLKYELSDKICHIKENGEIIKRLKTILV